MTDHTSHPLPQWWLERAPRGELLALFAVAGMVLFAQWLHGGLYDIDGYYHIRMASEYLSGGVPDAGGTFHWTQHSLWNGGFSDKDYLWHLFLAPFVWLFGGEPPGLERAGMVGAAVATGLAAVAALRVFRSQGIGHPLLCVLLLYGTCETFVYRVSLCRSYLLSIPLALLGWHLIQRRQRWALAALAAIYALAYTAPHLLFVLAGFWALTEWCSGGAAQPNQAVNTAPAQSRLRSCLYPLAPMLWIAAGIAFGLLIHPEPLNMARIWLVQNLAVPLHSYGFDGLAVSISQLAGYAPGAAEAMKVPDIGLEMTALTGRELVFGHFIGLGLLVLPWVWAARCGVRPNKTDAFAWLTAWAFFAAMLISERFAEYFYPFAVLAAGMLCTKCALSAHTVEWHTRRPTLALAAAVFLVAGVLVNFALRPVALYSVTGGAGPGEADAASAKFNGTDTNAAGGGPRPRALASLTDAIKAHVPPGNGVFHAGWDEFCELFYFAPEYKYVTGLDPVFMAAKSPEQYALYSSVGRGERTDAWKTRGVEAVIREEFGMDYALVQTAKHPGLAAELQRAEKARPQRITLLAEGDGWRIYRLLPPGK